MQSTPRLSREAYDVCVRTIGLMMDLQRVLLDLRMRMPSDYEYRLQAEGPLATLASLRGQLYDALGVTEDTSHGNDQAGREPGSTR